MRMTLVLGGCLASLSAYTQIDTEFWFAPPEVTSGHGDRPIYLRLSTLDKGAVVNVLQPARGNVQLAVANIPANTTQTIDLTSQLSNLETLLPATVMRTGIRIVSTAPITAYYEVGAAFNSDIFALKGRNALGNNFVIPGQNFYNNSGDYSPPPGSSFDIVATKDNTVVTVRPTKPLRGHLTDSVIVVKLNAGETYSFRKPGLSASENPTGTVVESNKPIAITIKDDSVINGGCRDLLGDQLVPIAVAGTEYVVLKGFLETPEYLFITATEDDTHIYIQGQSTPGVVLSAGSVYRHHVTEKSTYVSSNNTIYVFHVTGFGCEMGMAILPSINCKGSPQIGFTRTTNEFFGLNILVMKEGIGSFTLNGFTGLIPASAFTAVPGTNDMWYTAQMSFNEAEVRVGHASLISNSTHSFQVGIINGNARSTCRYGYFSSFSTLFIGDDYDICEGQVATLDAGPGKESYLWSTGSTSQQIKVGAEGTYWVKVEREDCILYDTIKVRVRKGALDLGPDLEVCRGDTAIIDGKQNFSWNWSDGTTSQKFATTQAGKYWVSVFDYTGCQASDTVMVSLKEPPLADVGRDVVKCKWETVVADATFEGATYRWNDGVTAATREIRHEGLYAVTVMANGCSATDSLVVENFPGPPQDSIYGTPSVCPFATDIAYRVDASANSAYRWIIEGGTISSEQQNAITVDWHEANASALVSVIVTDDRGCDGDTLQYPVRVNVILLPEAPIGPDTLCLNKSQQITYYTPPTNGSAFHWNIRGGDITTGQGSGEVLVNWREGHHALWIEETSVTSDTVCTGISPELQVVVFRDSSDLYLNFVSVDTANASLINVNWNVYQQSATPEKQVALHRRTQGSTGWTINTSLPSGVQFFADAVDFSTNGIYEYQLNLINYCDELLSTHIHTNIYLAGAADSTSGVIRLQWNHYSGWEQGVDHYEVWRRIDDDAGYRLFTQMPGAENSFSSAIATDAFEHKYIIRAVQYAGPFESWSNPVSFSFDHEVEIPNIITPNGDDFNQYFHIRRIELYKNSELTIFDRWGKEVYHVINYQNDWDGAGLSSGVYYYVLDLKRNKKIYKGPLTIMN